jgi:serine/threonine protein kinase
MEYCEEGDLFKFLESKGFKISEKEVIYIVKQIFSAAYYLQQYGITHRDIKPENILVKKIDGNYFFKIADFGLSKIILPGEMCEEPYGTLVRQNKKFLFIKTLLFIYLILTNSYYDLLLNIYHHLLILTFYDSLLNCYLLI